MKKKDKMLGFPSIFISKTYRDVLKMYIECDTIHIILKKEVYVLWQKQILCI